MAKPAVTLYNVKGSPLTTTELDTNFTNLRDSTINFTGDAGDTRSMDLNDSTAITGSKNIQVTVSESGQSIVVKNTLSDYSLDPMGFDDKTQSVIAFDNGTRTFTITPAATTFRYWYQGTQYNKTTAQSVTIDNTTDLYLIYFNGSSLAATTSHINWSTMTPVAHVHWNSGTSQSIVTDERHGIHMTRGTKEYLHAVQGTGYSSGLIISNYTTSGTGANNSDSQFDLSSGVIYDQDHRIAITHSNTPTANTFEQDLQGPARIPVLYHSGSTGVWIRDTATDYAVKNGTSLVTYNLNTAGTWTTPDCTTTYYVAYWIVATNIISTPVVSIMGQRQDNKLSDAVLNNTWDSLDLTDFPAQESRPLYRIIFRTASGYANTPKAFIAQVDDFRFSEIIPTGGLASSVLYSLSAGAGAYAQVQLDGNDGSTDFVQFRGAAVSNQYITTSQPDASTIAIDWDRNLFVYDLFTDTTSPLTGGQTINHRELKRCYVPTSNHVISSNSTVTPTLGGTPGMWRVYDLRANITQFNVPSDMEDGMEAMYVFYQNDILGTGNYSVTFNGYIFRDGANTISIVPGSLTMMTVRRVTVYGTVRYMAEIKKDYT